MSLGIIDFKKWTLEYCFSARASDAAKLETARFCAVFAHPATTALSGYAHFPLYIVSTSGASL